MYLRAPHPAVLHRPCDFVERLDGLGEGSEVRADGGARVLHGGGDALQLDEVCGAGRRVGGGDDVFVEGEDGAERVEEDKAVRHTVRKRGVTKGFSRGMRSQNWRGGCGSVYGVRRWCRRCKKR